MSRAIVVYEGRLKKVQFVWRSGTSPSSPPLDLTGATCTVYRNNLTEPPTVDILNAAQGSCELVFPANAVAGLRGSTDIRWVDIALTYSSNPGYSPDPVRVEVVVQ